MSQQQYPVTHIPSFIEGVRLMVNALEAERDSLITEMEEGNVQVNYLNSERLSILANFIGFGEDQIKRYKELKPSTKVEE